MGPATLVNYTSFFLLANKLLHSHFKCAMYILQRLFGNEKEIRQQGIKKDFKMQPSDVYLELQVLKKGGCVSKTLVRPG